MMPGLLQGQGINRQGYAQLVCTRLALTFRDVRRMLVLALPVVLILAGCQADPEDDVAEYEQHNADTFEQMQVDVSASARSTLDAESLASDAPSTERSVIVNDSTLTAGVADPWPQARYATAGIIPAHEQRPGDPAAGRMALLDNPYVSCGIPEQAFRQLMPTSGIVEAEGRNAEAEGLPFSSTVFTNREGIDVVSSNCLTCHGTPLFGELVIGLGNEFLDFTNDASVLAERAGALVQGDAQIRAWELYADRIGAIAPHIRPHTVGVNPANNLTFALIAHRHAEDNAWSDEPLLPLPPTDPPPVSVPPWWRMAKKPAMFNLGEGRLDHARIMMSASMLCSDSIDELKLIDAYAADIRAYIASLVPPDYPFPVDSTLAEAGRDVFADNCSRCHGTYEAGGEYPGRLVPIEEIGTDSTLVDFAHGAGAPYVDWFNRSYYGNVSQMAPGPGYVAPPLDGVWATAPFLHNGSVPTIAMVLNSGKRPEFWKHEVSNASDPDSYDQLRLGWAHTELAQGTSGVDDANVYDTSLPGYSNKGHLFGDHLTDDQRSAVIEYLKTL